MIVGVLVVALAIALIACVRVYYSGMSVRMSLARLVSLIYLHEGQREQFAVAYEKCLSMIDPDMDRGTRAAYAARAIESLAEHATKSNPASAIWLGSSRSDLESAKAAAKR